MFSLPKKLKDNFLTRGASRAFDQANIFDDGRSWQQRTPTQTSSAVSQAVRPVSSAVRTVTSPNVVKPLTTGFKRSIAGLGESIGGLYDLATPGKGTSQFTKNYTNAGALYDTQIKSVNDQGITQQHYNPLLYKAGQFGGEATQILATGGIGKAVGAQVKGTQLATKIAPKLVIKGSSTIPTVGRFLTRPDVVSNVVGNVAQGAGYRTARDQDNSLGTVALDTGASLALAGAIPVAGKLIKRGGQEIAKKTNPALDELIQTRKAAQKAFDVETNPAKRKEINKYLSDLNEEIRRSGNIIPTARADDGFRAQAPEGMESPKPKVALKNTKTTPISLPEKPGVALNKATANIDPNDPYGNRNIIKRLRNELGGVVEEDADMLKTLRKIEKETGQKGLVDQWYFDTGNVRASNAIANSKLRNSEELKGAIGGLNKKGLKSFDDYAAARAELRNYDGMKTSKDLETLQAIVAEGDAKYGQRYSEMNAYYKKMAEDMRDGGLIDDATLKAYQESDDYIRVQRDMEDLVGGNFGSSKSRSIGSTSAKQKRVGSGREVLSPTKSLAKRTQQIQLEIQRNKAASNIIDVLQEQGLANKVTKGTNKNTVSRIVNGVREEFEVPADIKKSIDNVNPYQLGVLARIISAPSRLLRAGATALSAPFTVTNYLRDQSSSALLSKNAIATHAPNNIVRGLKESIQDQFGESSHPLWKKFEEYAGDQTIFDELRNAQNTKNLLREVSQGAKGKYKNMAINPIRSLEDINSITERATRFQNFKGIYEKAIKDGLGEEKALQQAVLAARKNSVDFMRGSQFTRMANLIFPYSNAAVQGSRSVARAFKERPVATTLKSTGLATAGIAVMAYNLGDEDRRKAWDSINDFEKENNFILIGNPEQQEDGSWTGIYKMPKPQGFRELTQPAIDMAEAFFKGEDAPAVNQMAQEMLSGLTGPINIQDMDKLQGSLIPQAVKPWYQMSINKDLYTGNEIVKDFMIEGTDDPTKRAYGTTSGTARLIAEQLNVSPIMVEKAFSDMAGSLGKNIINASDNVIKKATGNKDFVVGGRSIQDDFKGRLFEAKGETLEENKSAGRKYYEDISEVSKGFNKNEQAAFNSVHPSKTNFLGEEIFDDNKRITNYTKAGAYLNNPSVLEADRKLNQLQVARGNPSNPLFELPTPLLTKVLLKAALPPGAKDPELSNLYQEPWYQDYQNARSKYFDTLKAKTEAEGKEFPKSTNPYPVTPPQLQQAMDAYSALPKGTGERSAWIKSNPGLFQQMTAQWAQVDAWENKERVAIGLAPVENEGTSSSSSGYSSGNSKGSGSIGNVSQFLRPTQGTSMKKVSVKSQSPELRTRKSVKRKALPKIQLKKSLV